MSPDQVSAITAMAAIVQAIGALPLSALMVLLVVGPWLSLAGVTVLQARRADREARRAEIVTAEANIRVEKAMTTFREETTRLVNSQEKRFEAVVRMYENNVKVVDDYHSLASDLTAIITLSTRTLEGLVQKIDNNQFCPAVRKGTGKQ